MNNDKISKIIKDLVISVSKYPVREDECSEDTELAYKHIDDSITFIKLVNELEKTFKIEFSILELSIDNFRSIEAILTLVQEKLESKVC